MQVAIDAPPRLKDLLFAIAIGGRGKVVTVHLLLDTLFFLVYDPRKGETNAKREVSSNRMQQRRGCTRDVHKALQVVVA